MKKFYFACLVMLFAISAKAQNITYHNYLDYTSEWYIKGGSQAFVQYNNYYGTNYFDGDTIINGNVYYKQYNVGLDSVFQAGSGQLISVDTIGRNFVKYLREDSTKKFYSINNNNVEFVLEDFNLALGDTFYNDGCVIGAMYTFNLGNTPLNYYMQFNQYPYHGVAEGIGNAINSFACGLFIEGDYGVVCYKKQNDWTCFDSTTTSLGQFPPALRLGEPTGENEIVYKAVTIFPNPAQDHFTLVSAKDYVKADVAIYSVQGGLVSKQTLPLATNTRVDLQGLSNGLYSVLITNTDGKILGNKKLVIAN